MGPRASWPQSLRTAVGLMLDTRFPAALLWGSDLLLLYNDPYVPVAAKKHPTALGRSTREVWAEVWPINEPIFAAVMQRGESRFFEDKLFPVKRRGFHEDALFTLSYSPVRIEDGSVGGTFVILLETTARALIDQEVRRMRRILEEGQHVAHMGSFEYIVATRATVWSEEVFRIYGLDPSQPSPTFEELMRDHTPPEDAAAIREVFLRAVENGAPYEQDHRALRPDGSVRWLRSRALPFFDARGNLISYVGATLDVTDAKRTEDALREADRRKDAFLAVLSHELRNPLAPIRNGLHVIKRVPPGSEPAARALAIVERQVGHLTHLVDDLLDVSRITRGKIVLKRERVDLVSLVRSTVEDHRLAFESGSVALAVAVETEPIVVSGDPTRLAQVVGNLLHNAVKFTPSGGRAVVTVEADEERGVAILRVRDTGRGIAPDLVPHLFDAFVQLDHDIDRMKGGLGLGLFIAKGLVVLHGGTLHATSQGEGQGTTLTVTLPLVEAVPTSPAPTPGTNLLARRVLIIEDNVDAATSLREVLELDGHTVAIAHRGRDGIELARSLHPDVVLCDIGLPEMSGHDVARTMRADAELSHLTLIALTGYATPEDVTRALDAGFDAHLGKPPDLDRLASLLRKPG